MGTRLSYISQIKFPSPAAVSADPNTLDAYEEGVWTPSITFATPGDLAVTYTTQVGWYTRVGNKVTVWFRIVTASFTYTTASGAAIITTLPVTPASDANAMYAGSLVFQGITKAGYTQVNIRAIPSVAQLALFASGSGQVTATLAAADIPSGGSIALFGEITYRV